MTLMPVHAGAAASPNMQVERPATAWRDGAFQVDRAGLISRSDVVMDGPSWQPWQSMPLGNGDLGAAVWAENGFTAQLNRGDTYPGMLSSGQVVIPGLDPAMRASDYHGRLNLYDATLRQAGGGMRADAYVDHAHDALIVEVSGADPSSVQTVRLNLWPGRTPQTYASGPTASLAETTGSGDTLAAITAAGRDVRAKVLNSETVEVQFSPRPDGTFRVIATAPRYKGEDIGTAVNASLAGLASPSAAQLAADHLSWWHNFWARVAPMRLHSADGTADYLESVRLISLYTTGAMSSPQLPMPTTNGGVGTLFRFSQDRLDWGAGWWHWNLRHQMNANLAAGIADTNTSYFNMYRSHLQQWTAFTQQHMLSDGTCIPEAFFSDGTGFSSQPGSHACDLFSPPGPTARILSTGPEVALDIWNQYLYTGDREFLKQNFPVMASEAQFLLDYAKKGAATWHDGHLHTDPSNALEAVDDTSNPATDVAAMKVIFPVVAHVADMLGEEPQLAAELRSAMPMVPDFTIASRDGGVIAPSETDAPVGANGQNPQLEPVWPWGLFGDDGGPSTALAVRTFENRPNKMMYTWDPSPVQAARLGLPGDVQQLLVEGTEQFQTCPSGLSSFARADRGNLCGQGGYVNPYIEWGAEATLGLQEALVQDHNGLLQVAPAWPKGWDADVSLKVPGGDWVSTQVRSGVPDLVGIRAGSNANLRLRNPWPGQQIKVVDGATGRGAPIVPPSTEDVINIPAQAGQSYLIERTAMPGASFAFAPVTGSPASSVRHLGAAVTGVAPAPPPEQCLPPAGTGPLVDWIPQSGNAITDASQYNRDAVIVGGGSYTPGPSGPALSLNGSDFVQSQKVVNLGPLPAATFAAVVRVDDSGTYRRLFDYIPIGGEAQGFLVDVDPANQIRFIGGGVVAQTPVVMPPGQFIKLAVTLTANGQLTVYLNGQQAWTGITAAIQGIDGCANLKLQFGADQAGSSRLTGAVGEMRIWPQALTPSQIAAL